MARVKDLRWIIGAVVLVAFGLVLWLATRPPPLTVQGEVSSDRVDISPRVAGRVAKLGANVGDTVERGAVIAELESPQLAAALIAARAALSVAKADLDRINSTRPETIAARKAELAAAEADVILNQETFDRKAQLARYSQTRIGASRAATGDHRRQSGRTGACGGPGQAGGSRTQPARS
jgi:HlyD family secretion protein